MSPAEMQADAALALEAIKAGDLAKAKRHLRRIVDSDDGEETIEQFRERVRVDAHRAAEARRREDIEATYERFARLTGRRVP